MAATPATVALERAGIAHTVHRYRHDPRNTSFGDEAVDALATELGVHPDQIFKTLVVDVGGTPAVAVLPVPHRLSLKSAGIALAPLTGGSAKTRMADAKTATRATGYVLGGVSPVGQRTALPTVVDASAHRWPTVLCSAGRRGMEIALAPADLIAITGAVVADIVS